MAKNLQKTVAKNAQFLLILFILAGVINIISSLILAQRLFTASHTIFSISILIRLLRGILNLICAYLVWRRNQLVIWVFGAYILLIQVYSLLRGYGFDLEMFVIMTALFMLLLFYRKDGMFQQRKDI